MSEHIWQEGRFWLISMGMGAVIALGYDCIRIFRRVFTHGTFWISMEDLAFWTVVSAGVFKVLYYENNGIFRWFCVMGAAVGMVVYKAVLGRFLVESVSCRLRKARQCISRFGSRMFMPLRKSGQFCSKKAHSGYRRLKSAVRLMKKRLTVCVRLFKIEVCTHKLEGGFRTGQWSKEKSSSERKKRID